MAKVRFIGISGTTGVTENMYVYEYLADGKNVSDMILVDCGVGFPEPEMYGVDLLIPDFTYVKQNKDKIRGILITHGHEDHIGALPFLLKDIQNVPVYATKLVAGFIEDKLQDHKIKFNNLKVFNPEKDVINLGKFRVTSFRVSHSVPDGVGYAIDTPEGKMFHVADYKFDWTPVDQKPFNITKAASLAGQEGILALASDCLGSTSEGYTQSEAEIESRIDKIVRAAPKQVLFTTISSNISRMQQAINVAKRNNRKVVFIGRSIDRKAEIAQRLGYLHYDRNQILKPRALKKVPPGQIMYIISGSYGQPGSALYRAALDEHDFVKITQNDTVIFSSDPAPPGSKGNVDFVVDKLIEKNIDVHYYDIQENLHVSGHGSKQDIQLLFAITRPKFFLPVGGTVHHMREFTKMANEMNTKSGKAFEPKPGDIIEFEKGNARLAGKIPVRDVMVDGLGIGDVGNVVLRDRRILAKEGVVIVVIQKDKQTGKLLKDPDVISRGFVYEGKDKGFLNSSAKLLTNELERHSAKDHRATRDVAIDFLDNFFYAETARRPMVLPVVIEV